jgi:hypothetical protein
MDYKEILFDEASHTYFDNTDRKYISVTTLLGQYKPKYDTDFWSMYTALKNLNYKVKPYPEEQSIMIAGRKVKLDVLKKDPAYSAYQDKTKAEWRITTAEACEKGSIKHNHLEDNINISKVSREGVDTSNAVINPFRKATINNINDLDKTDLLLTYPSIYNRFSYYIERGASIFAEKKVHLEEYGVAGMIDVPIIKGLNFCIDDWKTNKDEMQWYAGYYKKEKIGGKWVKTNTFVVTDERMLGPVSHLANSTLNHYALQLSMYAYILEVWGYKLVDNGLNLIHLRDGYPPKIIPVPYLKKEVQAILEDYKEKRAA